jgi:hypothetical protein
MSAPAPDFRWVNSSQQGGSYLTQGRFGTERVNLRLADDSAKWSGNATGAIISPCCGARGAR